MAEPSLLIVFLWELAFDSIGFSVDLDFISSFKYLDWLANCSSSFSAQLLANHFSLILSSVVLSICLCFPASSDFVTDTFKLFHHDWVTVARIDFSAVFELYWAYQNLVDETISSLLILRLSPAALSAFLGPHLFQQASFQFHHFFIWVLILEIHDRIVVFHNRFLSHLFGTRVGHTTQFFIWFIPLPCLKPRIILRKQVGYRLSHLFASLTLIQLFTIYLITLLLSDHFQLPTFMPLASLSLHNCVHSTFA